MKIIWNMVNKRELDSNTKNHLFLGITVLGCGILGAGLWGLFGRLWMPGADGMICFSGYAAMFVGFFGGLIYLYNHEF